MKFSPDLMFRVSESLARLGYCIFGPQELERLFAHHSDSRGRQHLLEEFAALCGATVETTPNFKSARFIPARDAADGTRWRGNASASKGGE